MPINDDIPAGMTPADIAPADIGTADIGTADIGTNRRDDDQGKHSAGNGRARRMDMRDTLPIGNHPAAIRQRIEMLEKVLERSLTVPGTNYRVGLDAVAGLVPVLGDLVSAAMGAYIVWEARNLGLPKWKIWRMAANVGFDTAVGAIPLVGDAFDVLFRSNTKNLKIIRAHLDRHHPAARVIEG